VQHLTRSPRDRRLHNTVSWTWRHTPDLAMHAGTASTISSRRAVVSKQRARLIVDHQRRLNTVRTTQSDQTALRQLNLPEVGSSDVARHELKLVIN